MSITENWSKSSRSDAGGNCVEVRRSQDGKLQVRDSKDPNGPVLTFTHDEWNCFIEGTKRAEFNL